MKDPISNASDETLYMVDLDSPNPTSRSERLLHRLFLPARNKRWLNILTIVGYGLIGILAFALLFPYLFPTKPEPIPNVRQYISTDVRMVTMVVNAGDQLVMLWNNGTLEAIDTKTQRTLWRRYQVTTLGHFFNPDQQAVYALAADPATQQHTWMALNTRNGQMIYSLLSEGTYLRHIQNNLLFFQEGNLLSIIDASIGDTRWQLQTNDEWFTNTAGTTLFHTTQGDASSVEAIRIEDRKSLWKYQPAQGKFTLSYTMNAPANQIIILQGLNDEILVLRAQDGNVLWHKKEAGATTWIDDAHAILLTSNVSAGNNNIHTIAYDLITGKQRWETFIPTLSHSLGLSNNLYLIEKENNTIEAFSTTSGQVTWQTSVDSGCTNLVLLDSDIHALYFTCSLTQDTSLLYAIDPQTGTILHQISTIGPEQERNYFIPHFLTLYDPLQTDEYFYTNEKGDSIAAYHRQTFDRAWQHWSNGW